jgi:hypothetical protein
MDRSRRNLLAAVVLAAIAPGLAAAEPRGFDEKAFRAAQEGGKPILVDVYATW